MANTHLARLEPEHARSNADLFDGRVQAVPREALSMGVGTILRSRAIVLMATGSGKAGCDQGHGGGPGDDAGARVVAAAARRRRGVSRPGRGVELAA